jgi:hypothetical protein
VTTEAVLGLIATYVHLSTVADSVGKTKYKYEWLIAQIRI